MFVFLFATRVERWWWKSQTQLSSAVDKVTLETSCHFISETHRLKGPQRFTLELTLMANLKFPLSLICMFWTVVLGDQAHAFFSERRQCYNMLHDIVPSRKYHKRAIKEWQTRSAWFLHATIMRLTKKQNCGTGGT